MTKKSTAETINDLDGLTFGQLFQIVRKIKITALLSILALFCSVLGGAYTLGKSSQQKDTAVMLHSPFSMRLEHGEHKIDFQNLTLMKDPTLTSPTEDTMVLSLREIKSDFDVIQVGLIVARLDIEELSWPWSLFAGKTITGTAYAQTQFNWNGHNGDMKYKEKFATQHTVHRFYSDGCILEYQVDANRRSIPSSFKWLKTVH